MTLSEADEDRIAQAVAAAEATTAGEIYCVLAPHVSDYRETPIAWAAGAAIVAPGLLAVFSPRTLAGLGSLWTSEPVSAALSAFVLVQAVIFILAALIVAQPAVRRALTPAGLKAERVRRAAMAEFLAKGLHMTEGRTGVLLFASVAERRAEVIADEAIYEAAPKAVWSEVAQRLTEGMGRGAPADGFVVAVQKAGETLAAHFPPAAGNPNELPDRPVTA
ncbi:putative membrane protein [Caulobacter ginsengisoli]|uniref:Membrane protein n=1 Tax=Caulobacter ginsengisoli TaxID=400775 RepID=A0ABU0IRP3_9CAUL|nr:TPM domain-containing protein [Caulobacter ginsengisoli]MDQ0464678.1 putative membrane protein [Caulobacter ginsengisoli]